MDNGVVVGVVDRRERVELSPEPGRRTLDQGDRLVVMSSSASAPRLGGTLPSPPVIPPGSIAPTPPQHVALVGWAATTPHLCRELAELLPTGSSVHLIPGEMLARARELETVLVRDLHRVKWVVHERPGAELAHTGHPTICGADSVVILGQHGDGEDTNGDATALAMLLRMRHGLRSIGKPDHVRIVSEVRDPRSASHVAPRPGDSIVSSDIIAMLLAQELLDPETGPVYRQLFMPGATTLELRQRAEYVPDGEASFADVMASARKRGEIALGFHPDPRAPGEDRESDRERLEEGDPILGDAPWLNPPRNTPVPESEDGRIVVLRRSR
jgi:hypothetical protein